MDGERQPVWAFVELGWPFTESASQGGRRIQPAELRAAVWHSIIAGARGILYFDHNFGPGTPGSTILGQGYADNRAMAKSINAQIKSLAPVLNSPTVRSGWSQGAGTTAMVKWVKGQEAVQVQEGEEEEMQEGEGEEGQSAKKKAKKAKGNLYVFAGSAGSPVEGRFSLPCVSDAKAEVVGENRTIPIRKGSFSDHFADGNAIHIYRIDGGIEVRAVGQGQGRPCRPGRGRRSCGLVEYRPLGDRRGVVAFLVGMLSSSASGLCPKRARPRSGMRAKRTQRLAIR